MYKDYPGDMIRRRIHSAITKFLSSLVIGGEIMNKGNHSLSGLLKVHSIILYFDYVAMWYTE